MIAQFVGDFIASLLGNSIAGAIAQRKRAKASRNHIFLCGVRVVAGFQAGLGDEWLVGEWSIAAGRMSLHEVTVPISATIAGSRRPAKWRELVGGSDTVVVGVRTETAELEWSMSERLDGLALRALNVPESDVIRPAGPFV